VISDKTICSLLFKQEAVGATITSTVSTISHSSRRPLLQNIIIILRINYKIIICTNNNNNNNNYYYYYYLVSNNLVSNNNNSRSLQDLMLLFKITMRPRKEFLRNVQTIWSGVFQQVGEVLTAPCRKNLACYET
jgi:hypothetical protein